MTQKDFEGHPGHRVPQERSVRARHGKEQAKLSAVRGRSRGLLQQSPALLQREPSKDSASLHPGWSAASDQGGLPQTLPAWRAWHDGSVTLQQGAPPGPWAEGGVTLQRSCLHCQHGEGAQVPPLSSPQVFGRSASGCSSNAHPLWTP